MPTCVTGVDLSIAPQLPFDGAIIHRHNARIRYAVMQSLNGSVRVNRDCVDIRRLSRHWLDERGRLDLNFTGSRVPPSTVIDVLLNDPDLIPASIYEEVQDIIFFGTIFMSPDERKYWLRCLSIGEGGTVSSSFINIREPLRPNLRVALFKRRQYCKFK